MSIWTINSTEKTKPLRCAWCSIILATTVYIVKYEEGTWNDCAIFQWNRVLGYSNHWLSYSNKCKCTVFCFVTRHTLWFYYKCQPKLNTCSSSDLNLNFNWPNIPDSSVKFHFWSLSATVTQPIVWTDKLQHLSIFSGFIQDRYLLKFDPDSVFSFLFLLNIYPFALHLQLQ